MCSVIIVEDDPMITELNRRYVERDGRFAVTETFSQPRRALEWLQHNCADLIILDFYMPQMNGLELLRATQGAGIKADVIMITAANDAATVDALTRLGVVDYLVKPFAYDRFCRALDAYCRRSTICGSLDQSALALLMHTSPSERTPLPKGMQPQTQERLLVCMQPGRSYTCEEISAASGLSAVTVRRYMGYLAQQGRVSGDMNYDTGGRPCRYIGLLTEHSPRCIWRRGLCFG